MPGVQENDGNDMSVLIVRVGDADTVMFDHSFLAGRGNDTHIPDLVIDDSFASTLHAGFTYVPGQGWYVQDCGSTNGTWLNDVTDEGKLTYSQLARVWEPALLNRGDKVRIGMTILTCVPV
jgi:pSer/pThr/pTyr-binding forkhead associated (FHA) protein